MRAFLLAVFLVSGCGQTEEVITYPTDERELWTREETIDAQAGLSAVGLQADHEKDDGTAKWSARLERIEPRTGASSTIYPFTLVGTNRAPDPVRLTAEIQLIDAEGAVLRTRTLRDLLLGPWQTVEWTGIVRGANPGGRLVANVQSVQEAEGAN